MLPHVQGVLDYLQWAEQNEPDIWLRDDIRIAWITVRLAARGCSKPHILATQQVLGLYPDQVAPAIEARRRALLGPLYDVWQSALPPKKPPASSPRKEEDESQSESLPTAS